MTGDVLCQRYDLGRCGLTGNDFGAVLAAACLAHDLGNPPFGHSGEDALRTWFTDSDLGQEILRQLPPPKRLDLSLFEGNAQGFRILSNLQGSGSAGGMRLTFATLAAFSKYPQCALAVDGEGEFAKHGFFVADQQSFIEVANAVGLERASEAADAWHRHPLAWLLEAADDICYCVVDVEDGFRDQHLQYSVVEESLAPLIKDEPSLLTRLCELQRNEDRIEFLRAKAISSLTREVYECFVDSSYGFLSASESCERPLLTIIPSAGALANLKSLAKAELYYSRPVVEIATAGFEVLGGLLGAFVSAANEVAEKGDSASTRSRMLLRLMPEQFVGPQGMPSADLYTRVLGITDFVSGMTDSYAVSLYKKITGISLPGR
jgi:dGTPase